MRLFGFRYYSIALYFCTFHTHEVFLCFILSPFVEFLFLGIPRVCKKKKKRKKKKEKSFFGARVGHFAATPQSDVVGKFKNKNKLWSCDLGVMATFSVRQKMPFFVHL